MANVRYYQHTAGTRLAATDRVPYGKDLGGEAGDPESSQQVNRLP